jgi:hypothetical protein
MDHREAGIAASIFAMMIGTVVMIAAGVIDLVLVVGLAISMAHARPNPEWEAQRRQAQYNDDEQTIRRLEYLSHAGTVPCPDDALFCGMGGAPTYHVPCCGEGDAYEADDFKVVDGVAYAVLTCNDPEDCREIKGKIPRPPGSVFKIPVAKTLVNHDPVNDTGHGWIWISPTATDENGEPIVYCWAAPPGL